MATRTVDEEAREFGLSVVRLVGDEGAPTVASAAAIVVRPILAELAELRRRCPDRD